MRKKRRETQVSYYFWCRSQRLARKISQVCGASAAKDSALNLLHLYAKAAFLQRLVWNTEQAEQGHRHASRCIQFPAQSSQSTRFCIKRQSRAIISWQWQGTKCTKNKVAIATAIKRAVHIKGETAVWLGIWKIVSSLRCVMFWACCKHRTAKYQYMHLLVEMKSGQTKRKMKKCLQAIAYCLQCPSPSLLCVRVVCLQ